MLKGLKKVHTHTPPPTEVKHESWHRGKPRPIQGPSALEKGPAAGFGQGSRCHPICLLSGHGKPMALTSLCKDPPRAAQARDRQEPFNDPQHLNGAGAALGAIPGDGAWGSISPCWKPLSSRTAFSSRCIIALCRANPAAGGAFSPASLLSCNIFLIPFTLSGHSPKHPAREKREKSNARPTRKAKPKMKKAGAGGKAQSGVRCLSPIRPLPVCLWGFDKSAFRLTK